MVRYVGDGAVGLKMSEPKLFACRPNMIVVLRGFLVRPVAGIYSSLDFFMHPVFIFRAIELWFFDVVKTWFEWCFMRVFGRGITKNLANCSHILQFRHLLQYAIRRAYHHALLRDRTDEKTPLRIGARF